jgi:serine/threonine-protein kinase
MLPEFGKDPENIKTFFDEASIAAVLHHPNVCQVFDFGCENEVLYIAMEWIAGVSFSQLLNVFGPERLPFGVSLRIISDGCAGLSAAHEACDNNGKPYNLVHRDVTPQNLLVTLDGWTKLADFGVARFQQQMHQKTSTGVVKGKMSYMAPEQLTTGKFDQRSDIFSMGCVLYEATVGKKPFTGRDVATTMQRIVRGDMDSPSSVHPDFPLSLTEIIYRSLERKPEDRYQTAKEMRKDIEDWLVKEAPGFSHKNVASLVQAKAGEAVEKMRQELRTSTNLTAAQIQARAVASGEMPVAKPAAAASHPQDDNRTVIARKPGAAPPASAVTPVAPVAPQAGNGPEKTVVHRKGAEAPAPAPATAPATAAAAAQASQAVPEKTVVHRKGAEAQAPAPAPAPATGAAQASQAVPEKTVVHRKGAEAPAPAPATAPATAAAAAQAAPARAPATPQGPPGAAPPNAQGAPRPGAPQRPGPMPMPMQAAPPQGGMNPTMVAIIVAVAAVFVLLLVVIAFLLGRTR